MRGVFTKSSSTISKSFEQTQEILQFPQSMPEISKEALTRSILDPEIYYKSELETSIQIFLLVAVPETSPFNCCSPLYSLLQPLLWIYQHKELPRHYAQLTGHKIQKEKEFYPFTNNYLWELIGSGLGNSKSSVGNGGMCHNSHNGSEMYPNLANKGRPRCPFISTRISPKLRLCTFETETARFLLFVQCCEQFVSIKWNLPGTVVIAKVGLGWQIPVESWSCCNDISSSWACFT